MIQKFILKILSVYTFLKHPKVQKDYRYFIRDNYFCRLNQIKYIYNDYLNKKKYKIIEFHGEFDQEIRFVIPFAYWHHLNGTLKKTISCTNTKEFYFFSENHEEKYNERNWLSSYSNYEVPNMTHSINFSYNKWKRVPFKEHYRNNIFKYEKPSLVIANKYNIEWDEPPVNYFDIPTLEQLIFLLKDKYQIIYNRPLGKQIISDNSSILDLNEHEGITEKFPEVILMNDLFEKNKNTVKNFNHLQLKVYANCENFISIHGGTAAFASYFGGQNIILSKKGIEHHLNEFSTIIPALSGARIYHAKTSEEVIGLAKSHF